MIPDAGTSRALGTALEHGVESLGLALDGFALDRMLGLLDLLRRWNAVYNLTALAGPEQWVTGHLLDSLSILPHLTGSTMLDVGTGPGFPGLPLAIANPEVRWVLMDSNSKKIAFVTQACAELRLLNASAVQQRVESWRPANRFEGIVSRAFSDLGSFARDTARLLDTDGRLYAMKGQIPEKEMAALPPTVVCEKLVPLEVPGLQASRHLVVLKPNHVTG